mgnify:CR=1 FL=1
MRSSAKEKKEIEIERNKKNSEETRKGNNRIRLKFRQKRWHFTIIKRQANSGLEGIIREGRGRGTSPSLIEKDRNINNYAHEAGEMKGIFYKRRVWTLSYVCLYIYL